MSTRDLTKAEKRKLRAPAEEAYARELDMPGPRRGVPKVVASEH
jgi:hypothetical protein